MLISIAFFIKDNKIKITIKEEAFIPDIKAQQKLLELKNKRIAEGKKLFSGFFKPKRE